MLFYENKQGFVFPRLLIRDTLEQPCPSCRIKATRVFTWTKSASYASGSNYEVDGYSIEH